MCTLLLMKVCVSHPQKEWHKPVMFGWNRGLIDAINDAPSFTREEEDDGVVWLPNRCCQERTGTAGCSYHLLLCHIHPSGLSLISDSVKPFPREHSFLCRTTKSNSLWQIGFLLSLPRLPSMVEKEDFEIQGLDFMVCNLSTYTFFCIIFAFWHAVILNFGFCWSVASFYQRTDCTTAAREPKS